MRIETNFPGGVRVDAVVRGFRIATDQPLELGGANSAPAPFELFLASLASCAGLYALQFCRKRDLPTAGLGLALEASKDPETGLVAELRLDLDLPDGFPEKYREAIVRAVERCAVKRALESPPRMTTVVREAALAV